MNFIAVAVILVCLLLSLSTFNSHINILVNLEYYKFLFLSVSWLYLRLRFENCADKADNFEKVWGFSFCILFSFIWHWVSEAVVLTFILLLFFTILLLMGSSHKIQFFLFFCWNCYPCLNINLSSLWALLCSSPYEFDIITWLFTKRSVFKCLFLDICSFI
jgi:di/tricarboxylate transporter